MTTTQQPEFWMRGPVQNIPPLLQPVAHALLQAQEEIRSQVQSLPAELLYEQPAGMASPAFHVLHICGVLDRLFTYARAEKLNESQLEYLAAEAKQKEGLTVQQLLEQLDNSVNTALNQLSETQESTLTEWRGVGRKQLPSTVIGLLFHAAEHTMRHTGQLLVTIAILKHAKIA